MGARPRPRLITALAGYASDCQQTTLDNYLGSGFACGISDQTYGSFNYSGSSSLPGYGMPAGSVTVTPITTPGNQGLQFGAGWSASTAIGIQEENSLFQFAVTSSSPITDLSLSIAGVGFTGTGAINVDETAWLGAMLPACSSGAVVTLSVFDSSAGQQLYDQANFSGVSLVDVVKNLIVQAGTNGSAEVSVVREQFSEGSSRVPEPGTISMFGIGIVAITGFARRKLGL